MLTRRVLTVFGTRPEAIKMAPVVQALERANGIDSILCVTAQHRTMLDQVLELFRLAPDVDLDIMRSGQDLTDITSRVLVGLREVIREQCPDRVLVHGDTTTTLAASLAAYYERVPVAHVEAGLRTGNIYAPWPEEINRRVAGVILIITFMKGQNIDGVAAFTERTQKHVYGDWCATFLLERVRRGQEDSHDRGSDTWRRRRRPNWLRRNRALRCRCPKLRSGR